MAVQSMTPWQTFVEVGRTRNLSRAAQLLGYTQSAISRQIAVLERELGTPLLTRGPRGVALTAAGAALLPHARLMVAEVERGRRAARSVDPVGSVALGAVPSVALGLLPTTLRELGDTRAWTLLTDLTPSLVDNVALGAVDLAVVTDTPPGLPVVADVETRHLFDDPMGVLLPAGHPLAGRRRLSVGALADEVWIEDNAGSQSLLERLGVRHGVPVAVDRSTSDLMTKVALVAAGHGIALVPRLLVPALRPDVRFVSLSGAPRRAVYAACRPGRADLDWLVAALTPRPASGGKRPRPPALSR